MGVKYIGMGVHKEAISIAVMNGEGKLVMESIIETKAITFWESEEAIRAFAGDDISVAKYYDFDKDFLLELEPCSTHYKMYDL